MTRPRRFTRRQAIASAAALATAAAQPASSQPQTSSLGVFSISLSVKDLEVSRQFYEKLGFRTLAGGAEKRYYVLKNGEALIGIFQGMFKGNILTFNPGWDSNAKKLASFTDVRELQRRARSEGIKLTTEVDEKGSGPAGFTCTDPDGNMILIDQHV